MEGKLWKLTKGKGLTGNNQWIERFYILNQENKELTFYQENKGKRSYRGQVSINNGKISSYNDSEKMYTFELTAKNSSGDEEIMVLAAPTHHEMIDWVLMLSHIAECNSEWITKITSSNQQDVIQQTPVVPIPPQSDNRLEANMTNIPSKVEFPSESSIHNTSMSSNEETVTMRTSQSPLDIEDKKIMQSSQESSVVSQSELLDGRSKQAEGTNKPILTRTIPRTEPLENSALVLDGNLAREDKQAEATSRPILTRTIPRAEASENTALGLDEYFPESEKNLTKIVPSERGAPFLRGSSGYDFGSKVHKTIRPLETIYQENDHQDIKENNQDFDNLSSWEFSCRYKRTIPQIGKKLLKRCRLYHQLLSNNIDTSITNKTPHLLNFQHVKETLIADHETDLDTTTEILISFPYLPTTGCNWFDILKYLKFTERNQNMNQLGLVNDFMDIHLEFDCHLRNTLTSIEIQFDWITNTYTSTTSSWFSSLVQKILSLNIHNLDNEQTIISIIREEYNKSLSTVIQSQFMEFNSVEKYILEQETQLIMIHENKEIPTTNTSKEEEDDEDEGEDIENNFTKADLDQNGYIDRQEWRNWMLEKEEIIKNCNNEKAKILQENQNLRKALNSSSLQIFHDLQVKDERISQLEIDFANSQIEIEKLQMELSLCYRQLQEVDKTNNKENNRKSSTQLSSNSLHNIFFDIKPNSINQIQYDSSSEKEEKEDEEEEEDDNDSSNGSIGPIDQYLPYNGEILEDETQRSQLIEADLTHLISNDNIQTRPIRRNSFEIVNSRPLQIRTGKTISNSPGNSINSFSHATSTTREQQSNNLMNEMYSSSPERSIDIGYVDEEERLKEEEEFHLHELVPEHEEHEYESNQASSSSWVHDYLLNMKEKNSLRKNNSSPLHTLPTGWNNLPPAINETMHNDEELLLWSKHPLCRDTLINGREHGLIDTTSKHERTSPSHHHHHSSSMTENTQDKKKLHPLHQALKTKTSQLAVPTSVYSPNLSKLVTGTLSPSNNPSLRKSTSGIGSSSGSGGGGGNGSGGSGNGTGSTMSKSYIREQQRTLPSSQRYLNGLTTSSINKLKRSTSSQLGAVRGHNEWK